MNVLFKMQQQKTEWEKWMELQRDRKFDISGKYISLRKLEERDKYQRQIIGYQNH